MKRSLCYGAKAIALAGIVCLAFFAASSASAAYTTSFGVPNTFYDPTNWSLQDANSTYQEWNRKTSLTASVPDNPHGYALGGDPFFSPGSPTHGAHTPHAAFFPSLVNGALLTTTGTDNLYMGWFDTENAPTPPYSGGVANIYNYGSGGAGEGTNVIVQVGSTMGNMGGTVIPNTMRLVDIGTGDPIAGGESGSAIATLINGYLNEEINIPGQGLTNVNYTEYHYEFFLPGHFGDFRVEWDQQWHSTLDTLRVDTMIGLDLDESVPAFTFTFPEAPEGAVVPEPASTSWLMLLLGSVGVIQRSRRKAAGVHS